jgi:hypothetical protein
MPWREMNSMTQKILFIELSLVEDKTYFAVSGFFKNAKPRKTPSVSIEFIDRCAETIFNF